MKKYERVTVDVHESLYRRMKALQGRVEATGEKISISDIVRKAVLQYLAKNKEEDSNERF